LYRGYGQGAIEGITAYAHRHGPWQFLCDRLIPDAEPGLLERFPRPDGILAQGHSLEAFDELAASGIPTVCLQEQARDVGLVQVVPDLVAIAHQAAEHFLSLGLKHIAWWSPYGPWFAEVWKLRLAERVRAAGARFHDVPHDPHRPGPDVGGERTRRWLGELPKPAGLWVMNDRYAQGLARVCSEEGIEIPDEIALLGNENDRALCELTSPPLSSVDQNGMRIGYRAAGLLDRLMRGEPVRPGIRRVRPRGVFVRQSTNMLAVEDDRVASAVRHIRSHVGDALEVDDVVACVPASRRALEMAFKRHLGHGIAEEIVRSRVEHAKRLLRDTDLSMVEIALAAGFASRTTMSAVFKRRTGISPSSYRRDPSERRDRDEGD
jgi:LacI family transcriptional regulator